MATAPLAQADEIFGPWHPGVESEVPHHLRRLATIFRAENASTDFATAEELRDLTGLPLPELVAFRPERLALHELLIRVTCDLSVPDGYAIGDLGINFRQMVNVIQASYIEPHMAAILARYGAIRQEIASMVEAELTALLAEPATAPAPKVKKRGLLDFLVRDRGDAPTDVAVQTGITHEQQVLARWEANSHSDNDRDAAIYAALHRVVSALCIRHGGIWGSRSLVAAMVTDMACNRYGSEEIGRLIEPLVRNAAVAESYRVLPRQEHPLVMNTKGPSASGKSSLRPLQKRLAGDIGVDWSDFALISPDIWRKQLIEYNMLGAVYKYGAAFTADEIQIVDHKLDRYMAGKARRGDMSHLLIDRFRFDSFAPDSNEAGSNLLTRFGHTVYLFFMVTPPASLVERAWARGLEFGRYKAVDDTLAHSIEAYSGMPQLFFTWIVRTDKRVHFEFLDNSVALGERPRTVAFGWNGELNLLDVKCLIDVERYRRVDVDARGPDLLFREPQDLAPEKNTAFLRQCIERVRTIHFADQASGRVYLRVERGSVAWVDPEALAQAMNEPDTRAGLLTVLPILAGALPAMSPAPAYLPALLPDERKNTLGSWGPPVEAQ